MEKCLDNKVFTVDSIPTVGKSWGATSYAQRKNKKTKIPDSQKDVHRRAKIGAQNPQKHKTAYRDCVT